MPAKEKDGNLLVTLRAKPRVMQLAANWLSAIIRMDVDFPQYGLIPSQEYRNAIASLSVAIGDTLLAAGFTGEEAEVRVPPRDGVDTLVTWRRVEGQPWETYVTAKARAQEIMKAREEGKLPPTGPGPGDSVN
jgi:hypothetical protein